MPNIHHPRRGSLQVWPRKRAKRSFPRMRTWPKENEIKLLAFVGYKAGMTHVIASDTSPHTMYKNEKIFIPVTIVECPPLKPLSLRFYKKSYNGLRLIAELFSKVLDKDVKKYIKIPKKEINVPEDFDEVRLRVYTQPKLLDFGKKKPETLEIGISGNGIKEKLEFGKGLLEKEIKLKDVLINEKLLDAHAVTKGKGFQGTVKRFGVKIRQHKSEKTKRGIGSLGSWHPNKVQYSVAQAGRMGYHQRTEYNKFVLLLDSDAKKVNPKSGFLHYGFVKNDYVILKGSIPGATKRTIILTPAVRPLKRSPSIQLTSINLDSKQ